MPNTTKRLSERDANQTLQGSFNDVDFSLTTNGFLIGKVGRKIDVAVSTTTTTEDTVTYTFSENGNVLYAYKLIYTDNGKNQLLSAERIA